jgi:hypothetical protein
MAQLYLPPHVHYCVTDDGPVFLNLRSDKYIGLVAEDVPYIDALAKREAIFPERGQFAASLINRGLLTQSPRGARPIAPTVFPRATTVLSDVHADRTCQVRPGHIAAFFAAFIAARTTLSCLPLRWVVSHVQNRKVERKLAGSVLDRDRARELVDIFRRLRPWFYAPKERCLLNSLALMNFLAYFRIFPTWVFAVRTNPFMAHCWVQVDDVLLNDTPTWTASFAPILCV